MAPSAKPKNHVCAICQERFIDKFAQKQHRRAKHTNASHHTMDVGAVTHRGIKYSSLSAAEQAAVKGQLPDLCHSKQRLNKETFRSKRTTTTGSERPLETNFDLPCPDRHPSMPKAPAIVLDCEMAEAVGGGEEVIQVTVVDFLSGVTLLNCLVKPSVPIADWREDITGINASTIEQAASRDQVLHGWEAARMALWLSVDKETVIIGHSVHHDLQVLHTSHEKVIDTAIVTADAVFGKKSSNKRRWGLKVLSQELLGIQIRKSSPTGAGVHDALEDALATREVALLCIRKPVELQSWAARTKDTYHKGKRKAKSPYSGGGGRVSYLFVEEEEPLRWEDVVDWDTWPKSPPDSD